jgi:hypothetical protein
MLTEHMSASGLPVGTGNRHPLPTDPLGVPTVARQLAVSGASASVALTAACRRVSVVAVGGAMRYAVGVGATTANAGTSHYIAAGERLDLAVPEGATIAAIRATGDAAGTALEITELGY